MSYEDFEHIYNVFKTLRFWSNPNFNRMKTLRKNCREGEGEFC